MQNISDDELDKIFQAASEKGDFPYDPAAWERMNSLLDSGFQKPDILFSGRVISSFVALGILVSTLFYVMNDSDEALHASETARTESVNPTDHVQSFGTESSTIDELGEKSNQTSQELGRNHSTIKREAGTSGLRAESEKPIRTPVSSTTNKSSSSTLANVQPLKARALNEQGGTIQNGESVSQSSLGLDMGQSFKAEGDTKQEENPAETVTVLDANTRSRNNGHHLDEGVSLESDSLVKEEQVVKIEVDSLIQINSDSTKDETRKYYRHFSLKLAVSPDFTTIGYGLPDKVGLNYGLLVEYQFAKNWVFSTGAIFSRKIYSGNDVEYTFSSQKYTADKLSGDCRIIDLPVNVYYYFKPDKALTFFASVGVTSYLILTEDYSYTIKNGYNSNVYTLSVEGKNKEWFKQLNISIGVQKRISNRIALQVEPFLKAPLAGVGEGKVSLASFGAFLNFRYSFNGTK